MESGPVVNDYRYENRFVNSVHASLCIDCFVELTNASIAPWPQAQSPNESAFSCLVHRFARRLVPTAAIVFVEKLSRRAVDASSCLSNILAARCLRKRMWVQIRVEHQASRLQHSPSDSKVARWCRYIVREQRTLAIAPVTLAIALLKTLLGLRGSTEEAFEIFGVEVVAGVESFADLPTGDVAGSACSLRQWIVDGAV